ncbi:MAG: hypothetical protein Q9172_005150 [Xanthocarpia lactea]
MSEKDVFVTQKELPPIVSPTVKKTTKANSCRKQPRASQASEKSVPIHPEVYYSDGLCPRDVSPTSPEVQTGEGLEVTFGGLETKEYGNDPQAIPEVRTGEGLERTFDGLETKPNDYDPPTPLEHAEESMPLHRRRKRIRIGLVLLVVGLLVALAAGLGGGLGSRKSGSNSARSNISTEVLLPELFNATTPLARSDIRPNDWRGRSIYQIMTDRFSPSNSTTPCDVAKRQYCGGTWQGIINQLDYIQNMGFTAVDGETAGGEAYHGYWQQNIYALNTQFGSISDLQALSTALHARDMYLMVDVVVNHFAWGGNGSSVDYRKMYPFSDREYFHPYCKITGQDYLSNQTAVEQVCLPCNPPRPSADIWSSAGLETSKTYGASDGSRLTLTLTSAVSLPDVDTNNSFVRQTYNDWISSLVSVFRIDGLRIDTVKHVEKSFWPDFKSAAGVYTLGEVFDGDVAYTCAYQEQLDGLLNYPLYYPAIRAFQASSGNMTSLGAALTAVQDSCKDPMLLATFSENHDIPRFLSQRNDMNVQMNVIAFTILAGGIPIIYQGQEQGFFGGNDPANREALWSSGYSTKTPLYTLIASVNQIRNHQVFAFPEYLTASTSVTYTDDHHIALRKGNLVSVYSNEGQNSSLSNITLTESGFQRNQTVIEILTCRNSTTDAQGNLKVSILEGRPQEADLLDKGHAR